MMIKPGKNLIRPGSVLSIGGGRDIYRCAIERLDTEDLFFDWLLLVTDYVCLSKSYGTDPLASYTTCLFIL